MGDGNRSNASNQAYPLTSKTSKFHFWVAINKMDIQVSMLIVPKNYRSSEHLGYSMIDVIAWLMYRILSLYLRVHLRWSVLYSKIRQQFNPIAQPHKRTSICLQFTEDCDWYNPDSPRSSDSIRESSAPLREWILLGTDITGHTHVYRFNINHLMHSMYFRLEVNKQFCHWKVKSLFVWSYRIFVELWTRHYQKFSLHP